MLDILVKIFVKKIQNNIFSLKLYSYRVFFNLEEQ